MYRRQPATQSPRPPYSPTLEAVVADVLSATSKQPALTNALDRLVIAAAPAMDHVTPCHVARGDRLLRNIEGGYFYRPR